MMNNSSHPLHKSQLISLKNPTGRNLAFSHSRKCKTKSKKFGSGVQLNRLDNYITVQKKVDPTASNTDEDFDDSFIEVFRSYKTQKNITLENEPEHDLLNSDYCLSENKTPELDKNDPTETSLPDSTESNVKITTASEESSNFEISTVENLEIIGSHCPLCMKKYILSESTSVVAHLKSCASKHNLTTKQIFDALQLQKKQISERLSLGLPKLSDCTKRPVKKPIRRKGDVDYGLELGMALSASLQEAEELRIKQEYTTLLEAGLEEEALQKKQHLQSIQKPVVPVMLKYGNDKIKWNKNLPLFSRSKEDRQRILTEKIAMILTDSCENNKISEEASVQPFLFPTCLKSSLLTECLDQETTLWIKSQHFNNDIDNYYVECLLKYFGPCKEKQISEIFLNLSSASCENSDSIICNSENSSSANNFSKHTYNESDSENFSFGRNLEFTDPNFSNNWINIFNTSIFSDITVYAKDEKKILCHKLVFAARCNKILEDIIQESSGNKINEYILWLDYSYEAVQLFLEFIYSGKFTIPDSSGGLSPKIFQDLEEICGRYNYHELVKFLKNSQISRTLIDADDKFQKNLSEIKSQKIELDKFSEKLESENFEINNDQIENSQLDLDDENLKNLNLLQLELKTQKTENRSLVGSPDLFQNFPNSDSDDEDSLIFLDHDDQINFENSKSNFQKDGLSKRRPQSPLSENFEKKIKLVHNTDLNYNRELDCELVHNSFNDEFSIFQNKSQDFDSKKNLNFKINSSKDDDIELDLQLRKNPERSESENKIILETGSGTKDVNEIFDNSSRNDLQDFDCKLVHNNRNSFNDEFCILQNESQGVDSKKNLNFKINSSEDEEIELDLQIRENPERSESENKIILEIGSGTKDVIEIFDNSSQNDLPETYVSPIWDGFNDVPDYNFYNDICISPCAPSHSSISIELPKFGSDFSTDSSPVVAQMIKDKNWKNSNSSNNFDSPIKRDIAETKLGIYLFEESLSIDEGVLNKLENGQTKSVIEIQTPISVRKMRCKSKSDTFVTPVSNCTPVSDDITPLADYSVMKTPQLKKELDKYGLKPGLGRNKAKLLLRYIYNELHPFVTPDDQQRVNEKISSDENLLAKTTKIRGKNILRKHASFDDVNIIRKEISDDEDDVICLNSDEEEDPGTSQRSEGNEVCVDLNEECFVENDNFGLCTQSSNVIDDGIKKLMEQDELLKRNILLYEPIWLDTLKHSLKSIGIKCSLNNLMDYLDEKCITFRLRNQRGNRRNAKKNKKT